MLGLESGYGHWSFDSTNLKLKNDSFGLGTLAGNLFAQPISDGSNYTLNLHLGWNFYGHAAVEAAIHATSWDLFKEDRGGSGFVGGRLAWYPLQLVSSLADRKYDAGVEFGTGYSIAGGPNYGMEGSYVQFGASGEIYVAKSISFALNLRYFIPMWSTYYLDYNQNIKTDASGMSAGWFTATLGVVLHVSPN